MDENFLKLKLDRAVWVAYLNNKRIEEAAQFYLEYINRLEETENNKEEALNEISLSGQIFNEKILGIGNEYFYQEKYNDALICYNLYFKFNPNDTDNIKNYITTLSKLGQYDLAVDLINHFRLTDSEDINIYSLIIEIYAQKGDYNKAIELQEKYIDLKQGEASANDYNCLGNYYFWLFKSTLDEKYIVKSLHLFQKSSDMEPDDKMFAKNIVVAAGVLNDDDTCRNAWNHILKLNNMSNDDKYDYAAFCLKTKNFDEWHKYFDARFDKENNPTVFPKINSKRWNGNKNISDSTLLVYQEQGFGDTIWAFGYMPRLLKLAKHVIFVVQNELYSLLKDNTLGVEVISVSQAGDLSKIKFNYYIPAMSIPIALKLKDRDLSVGSGYITADKNLVEKYQKAYFDNTKLKIGFSIKGNVAGDTSRNMPAEEIIKLSELKNVQLYCLNNNLTKEEAMLFEDNNTTLLGKKFNTFAETAAAMENCDLIISTDNVIINLAGALGKKTFGLFNKTYQFRWFDLTGDDVVWYTSVKPFVNDNYDDWASSIDKIIKEIKQNY